MISVKELSNELAEAISQLKSESGLQDTGIVTRVGDGVAWIYGLKNAGFNEVLSIETADGKTVEAFALNLTEDEIGAVLLGSDAHVEAGARVRLSGEVVKVPLPSSGRPSAAWPRCRPAWPPARWQGANQGKPSRVSRTRRPWSN